MSEAIEFNKNSISIIELSLSDKKLAELINTIGDYKLELHTDYYGSLLRNIIGQQLSVKAAKTIWNRFLLLCDKLEPEIVLNLPDDSIRNAGVSRSKTIYIKDLSQKVLSGEIVFESLKSLNNNEIIDILTKVKGVGKWTSEMFLIFSLGRLDVLSLSDVGLQRAIKWLYSLDEIPDKMQIHNYGKVWKPYRTVASLYLWEVINRGFIK